MSTAADARPRVHRPELGRIAAGLGMLGGTLGLAAGLAELAAGPSIRSWVGDKNDTTRLGLTTLLLAGIALAAAIELARKPDASPARKFALAAGLLLPGLICFTTVGRLWYLPGALLVAGGILVLAGLRGETAVIAAAVERSWTTILTVGLGCLYVVLGATALGLAGLFGVIGGILVLAAVTAPDRIAGRYRVIVLLAALVPFAALTWWSVVTPLIALLALTIGCLAINRSKPTPTSPRAH